LILAQPDAPESSSANFVPIKSRKVVLQVTIARYVRSHRVFRSHDCFKNLCEWLNLHYNQRHLHFSRSLLVCKLNRLFANQICRHSFSPHDFYLYRLRTVPVKRDRHLLVGAAAMASYVGTTSG